MNPLQRIVHFRAPQSFSSLSLALCAGMGLPREKGAELVALGAVYVDKVRRLDNSAVRAGQILRVHLQPRRFKVFRPEVVAETDDFVVLIKPQGVPTHPTLDNSRENLLYQSEQALGKRLWITHRLDQFTSGLVLFAKNMDFQRRFNRWLMQGRVKKTYLALTASAPATGTVVHYMAPAKHAPRVLVDEPLAGYLRCELSIERVQFVSAGVWASWILLKTGRTHQIRAQLAALGSAILGDPIYGVALSGSEAPGAPTLMAVALEFPAAGAGSQRFSWNPLPELERG